jgi:hypothetical protein
MTFFLANVEWPDIAAADRRGRPVSCLGACKLLVSAWLAAARLA